MRIGYWAIKAVEHLHRAGATVEPRVLPFIDRLFLTNRHFSKVVVNATGASVDLFNQHSETEV